MSKGKLQGRTIRHTRIVPGYRWVWIAGRSHTPTQAREIGEYIIRCAAQVEAERD